MVRFVRIKGRIIPIVQKAVAKGSGVFGRASHMKAREENIKALQAVRKLVKQGVDNEAGLRGLRHHGIHFTLKDKFKFLGSGIEADTYQVGNKVVKKLKGNSLTWDGQRRFIAENALSRSGYAPKGKRIVTNHNEWIVNDRVRFTASELYENRVDKYPHLRGSKLADDIGKAIDKTEKVAYSKVGLFGIDSHWGNWGFTGKSAKAKLIDGGGTQFKQWIKNFNSKGEMINFGTTKNNVIRKFMENRAKLQARPNTIKGKLNAGGESKIYWLFGKNPEETAATLDKLKSQDKFGLLKKPEDLTASDLVNRLKAVRGTKK